MLEEIIKLIKVKIEELENKKAEYDERELVFFQEKITIFDDSNIFNILNVELSDIAFALMRINSDNPYEADLQNLKNLQWLNNTPVERFKLYDTLLNSLNSENSKDESVSKKASDFLQHFGISKNSESFIYILKIFEKNTNLFKILGEVKILKLAIKKYQNDISNLNKKEKMELSREISAVFNKDSKNYHLIHGLFIKFRKYEESLEQNQKANRKATNKMIQNYKKILQALQYKNTLSEIKYEDLEVLDPEITILILQLISNNIYEKYKALKKDYLQNPYINLSNLRKIFIKYNIDFFNEEEQNLMLKYHSTEKIEALIDFLANSDLNFILRRKKDIMNVILLSNIKILENIQILIEEKIFPVTFIIDNMEIMFSKKKKEKLEKDNIVLEENALFERFSGNLELLVNSEINMYNIKKFNSATLFMPNEILKNNLYLASLYKINLSDGELYNFSILNDEKLFDILDQILELGLDITEPALINTLKVGDYNLVKRIIIMNQLKLPITLDGYINPILNNKNNFYIDDDSIDEYIHNDTMLHINPELYLLLQSNDNSTIKNDIYSNIIIKYLDSNFKIDDLRYNINGIIISRNKVLRNLSTIVSNIEYGFSDEEVLTATILYNSILNENKVESIINSISDFSSKKIKLMINQFS